MEEGKGRARQTVRVETKEPVFLLLIGHDIATAEG